MSKTLKYEISREIPDWAEWLAIDEDGSWYCHEHEPWNEVYADHGEWDCEGKVKRIGKMPPPPDWRLELYRLEWEWEITE